MATPVDLLSALLAILKRDDDLIALIGTRAYGEELPEFEASAQPRAMLFVRRQPGPTAIGGYVDLERPGFELACFGETPAQAAEVHREASRVLKNIRREVSEEVLVHSAQLVGSPQALREGQSQWPYVVSSWEVLASETQAT